jgi:hypothetical protein
MSQPKTPTETVEARVRLEATLTGYLGLETWTPVMGALLLSGFHAPHGAIKIPADRLALDNQSPHISARRFITTRYILEQWSYWHEDAEEIPLEMHPYEFLKWCIDAEIESDWLDPFLDASGSTRLPDSVVHIPGDVAKHAVQMAQSVDVILSRLDSVRPDLHAPVNNAEAKQWPASTARSPMPVPANRAQLSTDEFAATLAVASQSVRKRYSETGSYHGVRPVKLPNRRLLWPAEEVRRLLDGELPNE